MIIDQHGNETHPCMTMNRVIIDEHSPEFRNRMRQIIMISPSAMLLAIAEIESAYNDYIKDVVRTFRNRGPFAILDKVQTNQIRLQTSLFQNMSSIIDVDIKTICLSAVQSPSRNESTIL